MIYFFNNDLELKKIVHSENVIATNHEHELNNLTIFDVSMDLTYAKQFIDDVDHIGYYYRDEFYLHKINSVEENHVDESVNVHGRHKFFDDMLFGQLIMDFRPENRDALFMLRQAIDNHTDWQTVMTDTTGTLSTNFYRQVPYEALEWVMENFRLEFKPVILFDGQNINGLQLHVAKQIGEDKNIRVPFGDRVENMEYDIDYSEIVTKMAVHGKGEEVGDGYGRRINISSVNFNRNGVRSPSGNIYMEDPDITNMYGNDGGKPRHSNEIFEDIENVNELAEAGYERYLELSRPQIILGAEVAQIGDVGIGDSVVAIRREHNLYIRARVHKLKVDLLNIEDAEVVLGDYAHFKETKVERRTRERNNRNAREVSNRITQLKIEFDRRFDGEVAQFKADFEQALIDAHAEIAAAEVRMTDRIETERSDMMDDYNTKVENARQHAEQQAQEKADAVQGNLEAVTSSHQGILDDLQSDVLSIDDFLGSARDITLDERLQAINTEFSRRISEVDTNTYNMLRGTQFDESDMWDNQSTVVLMTDEDINYYRLGLGTSNVPYIRTFNNVTLEADTQYKLTLDYRTDTVPELDFIVLRTDSGDVYLDEFCETKTNYALVTDGHWTRLIIQFTPDSTYTGALFIGTHFNTGDTTRGVIDIRLPYLTSSNNTQWVYHPLDATQSIQDVTRRISNLEDGRRELITRSEYDYDTEQIDQTVKEIEETVDTSRQMIVNIENMDVIKNGSEVMQTVEGFEQKVWLNDVADIGANLIPMSANAWEDGSFWTTGNPNDNPSAGIRLKEYIPIVEGEIYTFQDDSNRLSRIGEIRIFTFKDGEMQSYHPLNRGEQVTFTADGDTLVMSLQPFGDFSLSITMIEHIEERVKMKLEKGATATPMMNSISHLEQTASRIQLSVADSEGLASTIALSSSAVDIITREINITADMNVAGDIKTLALDAIEGEFARLWADEFNAITITGQHIAGNTITGRNLRVDSAMVDKLIANTAFVNEINTLSLNAVRGDIADLRSRILTADVVNSTHLNVNAALANKFNANTAFISRLEVQAANIRDLSAIHIRGGMLDSLNNNLRFNLNTGHMSLLNTNFELGGNAKIVFTNRNNKMEYSNRGITSGIQFDHSLGSDGRPMVAVGVSDGAYNVNDSTYRGLIVHSLGTEGLLGYGSSIISQDGGFYTRTDRTGSGINFRLHATGSGAPRGIYPQYTGSYDYNLGSALNPWSRGYIRDIRTTGELWIRDWNSSGGWHVGTIAESGRTTITLRGVNTSSWNYNLGSGTYRMNNIYLLNSPDVSSDERLKEDIKSSDLGLDFINGIEIKSFRKKVKEADVNEGRLKNHIEFGLIAQQLRDNLISHNVDVEDVAMLSIDDDGYYGVRHEQLIAPTIRAVQELDLKVEMNILALAGIDEKIETQGDKIIRLEKIVERQDKEIQKLKGA